MKFEVVQEASNYALRKFRFEDSVFGFFLMLQEDEDQRAGDEKF
jgi:hypothetical protein